MWQARLTSLVCTRGGCNGGPPDTIHKYARHNLSHALGPLPNACRACEGSTTTSPWQYHNCSAGEHICAEAGRSTCTVVAHAGIALEQHLPPVCRQPPPGKPRRIAGNRPVAGHLQTRRLKGMADFCITRFGRRAVKMTNTCEQARIIDRHVPRET